MPSVQRRSARQTDPDEMLMRRYVDGDASAFEQLFRRYAPRACDDPERAFAHWFFQIAHRLLVDDRRRAYRAHEGAHEVPIEDRDRDSDRTGARDQVADREQLGQLLRGLSAEERDVLVCAKLEGIEYFELAAQLGKSVDAVKKLASRALQRLRAASLSAASPGLRGRS